MADPFRKVQAGQRLRIPAEAYNAFVDAALALRRGQHDRRAGPLAAGPDTSIVLVRNDAGSDLARFAVVGLAGAIYKPTENESQYIEQPVFSAVAPDAASYDGHVEGRFAILTGPLPAGAVGPAVAAGVCRVQVDLAATWHFRADILPDATTYLRSYPGGAAVILDIDRTATGVKLATVRLGVAPYVRFEGVLDETLYPASSATMSIWQLGSSGWEDSGYDTSVWAPRFLAASIPAGKKVTAGWHSQALRLIVDGTEC
ncbi:MAG: hypothetical protein NUV77_19610 [Thermoguttaceae bacterium]|jgi:hypothetical protein|nr:hypothetical protein [Thermoguttaceae bacterium]